MSSKAAKERRFRQKEQQRKHFEVPMRKFLQEKYPLIFEEYKGFYEALNRNHPYTRDLTKTCTYKTWVSSLKQQDASDILATALRQALGQEETHKNDDENEESSCHSSDQAEQDDDQDGDNQAFVTSEEKTVHAAPEEKHINSINNLTFTVTDRERQNETNEAANVLIDINDLADIMENVETQVDAIMNELVRDEVLADVLNQPVDEAVNEAVDEGIELNPLDDINIDIEPFDYDLEVENYQW